MILAAGRGERMRPLTDHCPKPLLPVRGRALIEWHLLALARAGFSEVVINHAWLGEQIEAALGDGRRYGLAIRYSPEAAALETAGGIAQALACLGPDPFLVMNGDLWCDWDLRRARTLGERLVALDWLAACVLVANPPHHPRGDFVLEGGRLAEIAVPAPSDRGAAGAGGSRPGAPPPARSLTFAGIGIYRPELFAGISPGTKAPLAPLLRAAAQTRRAAALYHDGLWQDIGTPERLAELQSQADPPAASGAFPFASAPKDNRHASP